MAMGSSGFPSTSSRALVEIGSHTLLSKKNSCHLFRSVVCHDSNDHHDGVDGMKRKTMLKIGDHAESLASNHLLCRALTILLLFHRSFTKNFMVIDYKIIS